ncbi:MAG: hypothetical protein M3Q91_19560 [Acidobacteriota bacterium]|nr:hypothetical protein [Acidobacteriota bacterium]
MAIPTWTTPLLPTTVLAPHSPFLTGKGTWHFAVGDANGDGRVDVITTNTESNTAVGSGQ